MTRDMQTIVGAKRRFARHREQQRCSPALSGRSQQGSPPAGGLLQWTVHLARADGRRAAACALAVLSASILVGLAFRSASLGLASAVLLVLSTAEFFLPVHYRLTPEAATSECLLSRRAVKWTSLRAAWEDGNGLKLTPLRLSSRLEPFRGIYLRVPGGLDSDLGRAVLEYARRHLEENVGESFPRPCDNSEARSRGDERRRVRLTSGALPGRSDASPLRRPRDGALEQRPRQSMQSSGSEQTIMRDPLCGLPCGTERRQP
jgi:hypothetical protein